MITRDEAIERVRSLGLLHNEYESRLLGFEIIKLDRDLSTLEARDYRQLWTQLHDPLERDILVAYAQLHRIDPAACARMWDGEEP